MAAAKINAIKSAWCEMYAKYICVIEVRGEK